jgi:hypothetical protein
MASDLRRVYPGWLVIAKFGRRFPLADSSMAAATDLFVQVESMRVSKVAG